MMPQLTNSKECTPCTDHPLYATPCPICTACRANKPTICSYCGLNTYPLAYHERIDCQAAMLAVSTRLREAFTDMRGFWEMIGSCSFYEELSFAVGIGEDFNKGTVDDRN